MKTLRDAVFHFNFEWPDDRHDYIFISDEGKYYTHPNQFGTPWHKLLSTRQDFEAEAQKIRDERKIKIIGKFNEPDIQGQRRVGYMVKISDTALLHELIDMLPDDPFNDNDDLKRCSCCASLDVSLVAGVPDEPESINTVSCRNCGLSITKFSKQEAIDAWNTRP